MVKILIIGGGFGGLSAAGRFCKSGQGLEVILLDKKANTEFLPLLPDCIGRGIGPEFLSYNLSELARSKGIKFIQDEIISVDLKRQRVFAKRRTLDYDYLLIASGSETNFYNNADIQRRALTLGSVDDVKRIRQTLNQGNFGNFIICGGGYTGIEIASNLRIYLNKLGKKGNIIIVEQAPAILGQLPQWMKDYVMINLKELKIEVYVNNVVGKTEGQRVILSGGMVFDKAMVIWAAGVRTAAFIQELKLEKNPQGRIRVDDYLRIDARCFAAGDAALFIYKGAPLRMAVQFAISQGECAALNIINSINGLPLRRFIPRDLGYIIPVANNRSCGTVLGADLKGRLPTLLHFVMCIYRSYGIKNRLGILSQLIGGCL